MGVYGTMTRGNLKIVRIREMMAKGAVILDVRTPLEFRQGHVGGARNYPLQDLEHKVDEIRRIGKPVILCCASGNRSAQATELLQSRHIACEDGGAWKDLNLLVQ